MSQEHEDEVEKVECDGCGDVLENGEQTIDGPDGDSYCRRCWDEQFTLCESCEEATYREAEFRYDGDQYCEECFHEAYFHCSNCGETSHQDYATTTDNGDVICERCYSNHYFTCQSCDGVFPDRDGQRIGNGDTVCENCLGDDYFCCDDCGDYYHVDDMCGDGDGSYCESCYSDHRGSNTIHRYEYKPDPIYHRANDEKRTRKDLFFGFELEVAGSTDTARDFMEMFGENEDMLYLKEDVTIGGGYEIVSHPFTWAFWEQEKVYFEGMLKWLQEHGMKSHDARTCGLHIHMSKRAFAGSFHLYKYADFVFGDATRGWMKKISRRKGRHNYCELDGISKEYVVQKVKHPGANASHYDALNLYPRNTAEFRLFRGTLSIESFFAAIEFCQAVFVYTRDHAPKENTPEQFCRWLNGQKGFDNLRGYLIRMDADFGIVKPSKKKAA